MKRKNCIICSHDVRAVVDPKFKIDYYFCPHCEFLFMDEAAIVSPEREKAEYSTHQNTLDNEGYVNMFREFIKKAVTPFQTNPGQTGKRTALDFGSGPGDCVLAHVLREERGYAVDIYDVYFAPEKVYTDKIYNLITCTEVLEHLKNPVETLRLLKQHLKPGGILALMTLFHPITEDNPGGEEMFQQWWYCRDVTHICFFRPKTLRFMARLLEMELLMIDDRNTVSFKLATKARRHEG